MEERVEYGDRQGPNKVEKEKVICPLLSINDDAWIFCERERCAWWDTVESRCIVVTLAVNVLLDKVRVPQLPGGGAAD